MLHILYLLHVQKEDCMTNRDKVKIKCMRMSLVSWPLFKSHLPEDWIRNDTLAVLLLDTVNVPESCYQISYDLVALLQCCVA